MTLYKQLTLGIFILFVAGLIGTLILSTTNMRTFLEAQLGVHAQDTATSLGLSVSTHLQQADMTGIRSMIDAVFDRGYFQAIKLIDINGDTLIERTADAHDVRIPS